MAQKSKATPEFSEIYSRILAGLDSPNPISLLCDTMKNLFAYVSTNSIMWLTSNKWSIMIHLLNKNYKKKSAQPPPAGGRQPHALPPLVCMKKAAAIHSSNPPVPATEKQL